MLADVISLFAIIFPRKIKFDLFLFYCFGLNFIEATSKDFAQSSKWPCLKYRAGEFDLGGILSVIESVSARSVWDS